MTNVTVLNYGAGNVRSVVKALEHVGAAVTFTNEPRVAREADRLVLPGQGHFGQCITSLERSGLADAVRHVVAAGRPFLGICVGMQLLYEGSEEAPDVPGLGLLRGRIARIPTDLPLPHVGWNSVRFTERAATDPLLEGVSRGEPRYFYHVHSYARLSPSDGELLGESEYEVPFGTMVGGEGLWGVQFHPEKSQEAGLRMLRNFSEL